MAMTNVTIRIPEGVLASLRLDPGTFAKELSVAAAVKWYESGVVSQERAAEICGLSRSEFMEALSRFKVSPFQATVEELIEEANK